MLQGASVESMELRAGGMIMEECPRTVAISSMAVAPSSMTTTRTSLRGTPPKIYRHLNLL